MSVSGLAECSNGIVLLHVSVFCNIVNQSLLLRGFTNSRSPWTSTLYKYIFFISYSLSSPT